MPKSPIDAMDDALEGPAPDPTVSPAAQLEAENAHIGFSPGAVLYELDGPWQRSARVVRALEEGEIPVLPAGTLLALNVQVPAPDGALVNMLMISTPTGENYMVEMEYVLNRQARPSSTPTEEPTIGVEDGGVEPS
jgi:hypothetical protein